jgi:hypothetical protein
MIQSLQRLTVKTVAVTPEPHVKVELEIPQLPLELLSVNPDPAEIRQSQLHRNTGELVPDAVAVKVAQVPLLYHVPALIKHPVWVLPETPFKYPEPEKVPVPPVGVEPGGVEEVGVELPDLGRYLIPVEGQSDDAPTGVAGTNVPDWTEPRTS